MRRYLHRKGRSGERPGGGEEDWEGARAVQQVRVCEGTGLTWCRGSRGLETENATVKEASAKHEDALPEEGHATVTCACGAKALTGLA